jgi:iron complex outermembrane receptor protein
VGVAATAVLTLTLSGPALLAAQVNEAVLSGTVSDQTGARIADARVVVVSGAGATVAFAIADREGRFRATVAPGRYLVRVSSPGFADAEQVMEAAAGAGAEASFTLDIAGLRDESVVVGRDYRVTATATATRTETPVLRVPQSLQVVNAQVIADQRPLILSDALRNVSGVSSLRNSAEVFRTFNIRGFNVLDLTVDGVRNTYGLNDQPDAVAHLERIEVLKGPAASIYGRGNLGGTVNLLTKSPERQRAASVSFSTGSWGLVQPTIDVTGALNRSGTVRARAVLDYENRDTPIDFVSVERLQVAPSIAFDLGPRTTALLKTDYRRREGVRFVALPAYGTVIGLNDLRVPYNLFIGEPGAGETVNTGWQTTARVDQRLGGTWSVVTAVRWTDNTFDMPSAGPRALLADNRTLTRRFTRFDETETELAVDGWLTGRVRTGAIMHTLVVGADASRFEYDSQFFSGSIGALDIAAPAYGAPVTGVFLLDHTLDRFGGGGIYAQDQIALTPQLEVLLGARVDRLTKTRVYKAEGDREDTRSDTAVSPRAGASFLLRDGVALFGSYGEALVPVADGTTNRSGVPFRPQAGDQWEGGIKLDLLSALSLTVSAFTLTRDGIVVPDPNDPPFLMQSGEQRSRGLELDAAWDGGRGLSVLAAYAFIDGEVTRDTAVPVGNELMNTPRHSGRLWGKYAFTPTNVGVWAIAGGVTATGEQQANLANNLAIPSSWVADLGAFWEHRRLGVQLNVVNLFDKQYVARGAFGNTGVIPGDTRRVVLTVKARL